MFFGMLSNKKMDFLKASQSSNESVILDSNSQGLQLGLM